MSAPPEELASVSQADLSGTNIVVTGATDGIGRETAMALARLGATVIIHGRSPEKAATVVDAIEAEGGTVDSVLADFTNESAVLELADAVLEQMETVDVLINNAGAHFQKGRLTDDGIERTFAVNHVAPFVLTNRLAPAIESVDGRVITVASGIHRRSRFDIDSIDSVQSYDGLEAYGESKFANILFTYALARRLESATTNCLHPGFVPGSALWREGGFPVTQLMQLIGALPDRIQNIIGKTPAAAAATPVYLAASDAVTDTTGEYFIDMDARRSAERTYDRDLQEELWERTTELVSMDEDAIL